MPTPLAPTQQHRLERFKCARSVDIHCHVLPGLDDGPQNIGDALAVCRALVQDGLTDVIATPHQLGRWDGTNAAVQVRQAVVALQERLDAAAIPLTVHPGGEVRLDERIPKLIGTGSILTLADQGVYLLLELPLGLTVDPTVLVPFLTQTGTRIVLAHAERYDPLVRDLQAASAWAKLGVALQVNATSLLGEDDHAMAAWDWIDRGWVSIIATDTHSTNTRRPRMSDAIERIVQRQGTGAAKRICIENPARVLDGQELLRG